MTSRTLDRTTSAILLCSALLLAQGMTFVLLGRTWWKSFQVSDHAPLALGASFKGELFTIQSTNDRLSWQIGAIDPRSGRVRTTDLPFLQPWQGMVVDSERLWIVSRNLVVETDGQTQIRHFPRRALISPICMAFPYRGSPAIVDVDASGTAYRLLVFEDQEWHDRGAVGIPGSGRKWIKNEETGTMELQPCFKSVPPAGTATSQYLHALTVGEEIFLFHRDYVNRHTSYRRGLDLYPNDSNAASAMAPENDAAETSGWTRLELMQGLWGIVHHQDRLVIVEHENPSKPIQFWEMSLAPDSPPLQPTCKLVALRWESLDLIESPDGDELYFIHDRPLHPKFYRYRGDHLDELPAKWETDLNRIVRLAIPIIGMIAIVRILGMVLLVIGAEWISRSQEVQYGFGARIFWLAPLWRRCVARGIDLSLALAIFGTNGIRLGFNQIAVDAYEIWYSGLQDSFELWSTATGRAIIPAAAWALMAFVVLILTQARWGQTPGKWICGVCTMRSTLRPCGFGKSLLRELFFVLDAGALLTILPGIVSLLVTDRRQRLGDLIADTVVVQISNSRRAG